MTATPPYRIETVRLVLRCWEPRDARLLEQAVVASLDHLRPWMPWAQAEPQLLEQRVELLRGFRSRFDAGEDFVYGIFSRDEREVLGGTGLHTRAGEGAFEIGYWIRVDAVGQGLATEATAALTRVALELCGVDLVVIRVDPANERSLRVPRRLGYVEEARLRRRLAAAPGERRRDAVVFSLVPEELPASPAASAAFTAYDALGRPLA